MPAGATPARLVHTPQLIRVWSLASAPGFLPLPVSGSSGIYRFDSLVPPGFCPWIDLELAFVCISHSAGSQRARAGCRFRAWLAVLSSPRSLLPAAGRAPPPPPSGQAVTVLRSMPSFPYLCLCDREGIRSLPSPAPPLMAGGFPHRCSHLNTWLRFSLLPTSSALRKKRMAAVLSHL